MTTNTLRPIETRYAGCRFRSRLEARWAVFFDHMGIPWNYEPQGYVLADGRRYLPDFYLPEPATWVEVKGSNNQLDVNMFRRAAQDLPRLAPEAGEIGPKLLLLGPIPRPHTFDWGWIGGSPRYHGQGTVLHRWGFGPYHKNRRPWWLSGPVARETVKPELEPSEHGCHDAYKAAASARFEHGENG